MIWRANDSEHDREPFYGFGFGNQQKIPYFKGANKTKRSAAAKKKKKKKEIGFTYLLKKEKNSKLKRIKRAKHAKEKLKCENQKSINRAPFRVSADEI